MGAATSNLDAEMAEAMPTREFTIRLKKDNPDDKLGLRIMRSVDSTQVVIDEPTGKAMTEWNENNPTKQVRSGDELVSVCGISGDADAIMHALSTSNIEVEIVL